MSLLISFFFNRHCIVLKTKNKTLQDLVFHKDNIRLPVLFIINQNLQGSFNSSKLAAQSEKKHGGCWIDVL